MTLMNRLQKTAASKTYSILNLTIPRLDQSSFADLIHELESDLYDSKTGKGVFILTNSGRIKGESAIDAIAIGSTTQQTDDLLEYELRARLEKFIKQATLGGKAMTGT